MWDLALSNRTKLLPMYKHICVYCTSLFWTYSDMFVCASNSNKLDLLQGRELLFKLSMPTYFLYKLTLTNSFNFLLYLFWTNQTFSHLVEITMTKYILYQLSTD